MTRNRAKKTKPEILCVFLKKVALIFFSALPIKVSIQMKATNPDMRKIIPRIDLMRNSDI